MWRQIAVHYITEVIHSVRAQKYKKKKTLRIPGYGHARMPIGGKNSFFRIILRVY